MFKTMLTISFLTSFIAAQDLDLFLPVDVSIGVSTLDIKGNVRKVKQIEYDMENSDVPKKIFKKLVNDSTGEAFRGQKLSEYFERDDFTYYTYNNKGQLIKVEEYDEDGTLDDKTVYHYYPGGQLKEECDYDEQGKLEDKHIYEYNVDGKLIKDFEIDRDGKYGDVNVYTYYKNGNLFEHLDYDNEMKLERRTLYLKYDDNGNWLKKIMFSCNDESSSSMISREITYRN